MKKNLLFTFLFSIALMTNAQEWNFTNSDDGWNSTVRAATSTYPEFLSVKFTSTASTAQLGNFDCNINTQDVHIIAVTLKNPSEKPTYLKIGALNRAVDPKNAVYVSYDISGFDTDFKTYYFDMTNKKWKDEIDSLKLIFGNVNQDDSLLIDKIELLSDIPTTEKHIFEFNTLRDNEYWDGENVTINSVENGLLTVSPTANKFAKLRNMNYHVDANSYNSLRIVMKNNSTDDDSLTFVSSGGTITFPITTSDAGLKTYEIYLGDLSGWTGNVSNIFFKFNRGDGKSSGTGSFEIDKIEFFAASVLKVKKHTAYHLTLAPNPSHGLFRIDSEKPLAGYYVYSTTGQVVKQETAAGSLTTTVDISGANNGVYFIKVMYKSGETRVVQAVKR